MPGLLYIPTQGDSSKGEIMCLTKGDPAVDWPQPGGLVAVSISQAEYDSADTGMFYDNGTIRAPTGPESADFAADAAACDGAKR